MTLSKHVAELEHHMPKWIAEFLNKFQGCGIKIARVDSIWVGKPLILLQYLSCHSKTSDVIISHRFLKDFFAFNLHLHSVGKR